MAVPLTISATGGLCSISVTVTSGFAHYMSLPSDRLTIWFVHHGYINWVAAVAASGGSSNGWTISGLANSSITYDVVATTGTSYPHSSEGLTSNTAIATTMYVAPPVPKPKGFAIGMFGVEHAEDPVNGGPVTSVYFQSPPAFVGYNTSHLNILGNDGFNLVHDYNVNWCNLSMVGFLKLVANNEMKLLIEEKAFYKPNPPPPDTMTWGWTHYSWAPSWLNWGFFYPEVVHHPSTSGINIYDSEGLGSSDPAHDANEAIWKARPNYLSLYEYVYSRSDLKDTLWGHQISEEAAYLHWQQFSSSPVAYGDPTGQRLAEVPPVNVYAAITLFRSIIDSNQLAQRLIVMDANHAKSIQDNTVDGDGYYNVPNYIHGDYWSRYDTFFEGSYCRFPTGLIDPYLDCLSFPYSNISSNGLHYLGFLKSIDYVMSYVPEVHKVLAIDTPYTNGNYDFNSDYALQHASHLNANGNWLWFQAYASIVHGAAGIWFWWLRGAWVPSETRPVSGSANYFEQLPAKYTNFVAPLARELRYLLNQGFLHPDQSTLIHRKTDSTDIPGIVPSPYGYGFPQLTVDPSHMTEQYGIRYCIRSSGAHVIMIAVNPLPVHVKVPFNVALLEIPLSAHVNVLFETAADNPMTDPTGGYKANRNGRATLPNGALTRPISYTSGNTFTDTFAPMDVHVYLL